MLLPEALHVFRSDAPHAVCSSVIPLRGATTRVLGSDFHFEIATPKAAYLFRVDRAPPADGTPPLLERGRSREPSTSTSPSLFASSPPAGDLELSSVESGKRLAAWVAALQRAQSQQPDAAAPRIARVHHLTLKSQDGLLRQVGQKRREFREFVTPERARAAAEAKAAAAAAAAYAATGGEGPGTLHMSAPTLVQLSPARAAAAGAAAAVPTAASGFLWKWQDGESSWRRLWCLLQGHALLCYPERHADGEAGGATVGGVGAVPAGVELERPAEVLWPTAGTLARVSDTVGAPSEHVFALRVAGGRRHRLCLEAGASEAQLDEWIALLGNAPTGAGTAPAVTAPPPATPLGARLAAVAEAPSPTEYFDPEEGGGEEDSRRDEADEARISVSEW